MKPARIPAHFYHHLLTSSTSQLHRHSVPLAPPEPCSSCPLTLNARQFSMLLASIAKASAMADGVFEIDGDKFDDFAGFIREFNRAFVAHVGGQWNGNLDAFHDYLSWPSDPYTLRWRKSWKSRRDLGYEATIVWYLKKIMDSSPPSKSTWWEPLQAARKHQGPTLFDWLLESIAEN